MLGRLCLFESLRYDDLFGLAVEFYNQSLHLELSVLAGQDPYLHGNLGPEDFNKVRYCEWARLFP